MFKNLPEYCYADHPVTGEAVRIDRGEPGYWTITNPCGRTAKALNEEIGVTDAQAQAMQAGSMFGWDVPAADPAHPMYSSNTRIYGTK